MTPLQKQRHIHAHAEVLVGYLLDDSKERDDFVDQYADQYWDDAVVEASLGLKSGALTEEMAAKVCADILYDTGTDFMEVVAYNGEAEHVYASAIKLAVLLGIRKVPKLSPADKKYLSDLLKPETADA